MLWLVHWDVFGYNADFGLSCELLHLSTKNIVNTVFRCILLGIVLMNLVMFGYLLHYMRNRLIKIHLPQKFMFTRRQSRIDISFHLGSRVLFVTGILLLLNSACNPIVYVWRFSKSRYHMNKLFCFWNKEKLLRIDQMYNQETATYEI